MWLPFFLLASTQNFQIWRKVLIVAIPKPKKPEENPNSYRPISLLCVPCKILKKLSIPVWKQLWIHSSLGSRLDFDTRRQLLTNRFALAKYRGLFFEAKKKAGAVFVHLTAAYNTVWDRGFTSKLLRLVPDKHMVWMILELIRSRSFTLTTGDSKQSKLRRLRNDVAQGSVLAPPSFLIFIFTIFPL